MDGAEIEPESYLGAGPLQTKASGTCFVPTGYGPATRPITRGLMEHFVPHSRL